MKKLSGLFTFALLSLMLVACGGNTAKTNSNEQTTVETIEAKTAGIDADAWSDKLNQLFTKEMAAEALGFDAAAGEEDYDKSISSMQRISYKWENGRITQITSPSGNTYKLPTEDWIRLKSVENLTLNDFKNKYRDLTQEEKEYLGIALDEKADKGEISKSEAEGAKDLGKDLSGLLTFQDVNDLGEYAVWNKSTNELHVFYREMKFTLEINVSNDTEENKEKSITAARLILKKL